MTSLSQKEFRVAYCGGRACPTCHQCCDWYYDSADHNDCDHHYSVYTDHLGPLVGPLYNWHRRVGATCGYHAYPHYVYYAAYHGNCSYLDSYDYQHTHGYPRPAIHGPHICHCKIKKSV